MTVCPIAIALGCARCPALKICPLKGVIGDHKPPTAAEASPKGKPPAAKKTPAAKKKA
jgi:hypothetical protein